MSVKEYGFSIILVAYILFPLWYEPLKISFAHNLSKLSDFWNHFIGQKHQQSNLIQILKVSLLDLRLIWFINPFVQTMWKILAFHECSLISHTLSGVFLITWNKIPQVDIFWVDAVNTLKYKKRYFLQGYFEKVLGVHPHLCRNIL